MGLMRALTLKRSGSTLPTRLHNLKGRLQISLPTELLSTTNALSYTAPSVESMQLKAAAATSIYGSESDLEPSSSAASQHTPEWTPTPTTASEASSSRRGSGHSDSAPSLTDASSVSSSPSTPPTHHAFAVTTTAGYFTTDSFSKPTSAHAVIAIHSDDTIDPLTVVAPAVPRRAPSHSKREHERLARRRSQRVSMKIDTAAVSAVEHVAPLTAAMPGLVEEAEEAEVFAPAVTVVEMATETEEQALDRLVQDRIVENEEMAYMRSHNLKKFSVSGYLDLVGEMWGMEAYTVDDVMVVA